MKKFNKASIRRMADNLNEIGYTVKFTPWLSKNDNRHYIKVAVIKNGRSADYIFINNDAEGMGRIETYLRSAWVNLLMFTD